MKNNMLFRICSFLLLSLIFISCTKDSTVSDAISTGKNVNGDAAVQKSISNGSLAGLLSPIPVMAKIHVYHSSGYEDLGVTDANGGFRIDNLPSGIYTVLLEYISSGSGNTGDNIQYKKMTGIRISGNTLTDLGTIAVQ